ncbi:PHP domain-containing protein [Synechococcus sp. PCC 7336]|uniref:PHP domain-containing protein n=1 Tax=Synechococcus sp. PCC 7336 TaxID=195250 RepID=UPI000349469A|nr:PHP domain-containing protein [Synechococcus sp. PCC 7336]
MIVQVASRATIAQLQTVWQEVGPDSCPLHYNFHMHTSYSDGQLDPSQIVQQTLDLGLQGFAITDHHTVEGYRQALHLLPSNGPTLWSGMEINAGLLDCEVHILAYGFEPDHPAMVVYQQKATVTDAADYDAAAAIAAIHKAGGFAVLAHPFRYRRNGQDLILAAVASSIDGVESYYSYANPVPWVPSPRETQQSLALAARFGLYSTCGTDTHGRSLLKRV